MLIEIPLFPLQTVLFPETPLYLHIFEPRYKIMLRRCLAKNEPFGVVLIQQGQEAFGPISKVYNVGCTAHIVNVKPNSLSSYNLTAFGSERFRILELNKDRPYMIGTVETYNIPDTHTNHTLQRARNLKFLVQNYLELMPKIEVGANELMDFRFPEKSDSMINMAASLLQLPGFEKQRLLESQSISDLVFSVERLYRREISIIGQLLDTTEKDARRAAWLN